MTSKSLPDVDSLITNMAKGIQTYLAEKQLKEVVMVGIHTGGVWIAKELHERLKIQEPLGELNISFYRDDFSRIGLHPRVQPSQLSGNLDDKHIILVDDVVQTGRTTRAALNELFDYGRPASVCLAVLISLPNHELPIRPDITGAEINLSDQQRIKLLGPKPLKLKIVNV